MASRATPLLGLLRALEPDDRAFAADVGTTVVYLYQLAGQPFPNPKLRMAKAIVEHGRRYARKALSKPLSYDDLLIGTGDPSAARLDGD